jgi:hypothetical protein
MTVLPLDPSRPRLVLGFDAEDRRALGVMAGGAALIIPGAAWLACSSSRRRENGRDVKNI